MVVLGPAGAGILMAGVAVVADLGLEPNDTSAVAGVVSTPQTFREAVSCMAHFPSLDKIGSRRMHRWYIPPRDRLDEETLLMLGTCPVVRASRRWQLPLSFVIAGAESRA